VHTDSSLLCNENPPDRIVQGSSEFAFRTPAGTPPNGSNYSPIYLLCLPATRRLHEREVDRGRTMTRQRQRQERTISFGASALCYSKIRFPPTTTTIAAESYQHIRSRTLNGFASFQVRQASFCHSEDDPYHDRPSPLLTPYPRATFLHHANFS